MLSRLFSKSSTATSTEHVGSYAGHIIAADDFTMEERKQYSQKLGRWRAGAIASTGSDVFVFLVEALPRTRAPIVHLSSFLKSHIASEDLDSEGALFYNLYPARAETYGTSFKTSWCRHAGLAY